MTKLDITLFGCGLYLDTDIFLDSEKQDGIERANQFLKDYSFRVLPAERQLDEFAASFLESQND